MSHADVTLLEEECFDEEEEEEEYECEEETEEEEVEEEEELPPLEDLLNKNTESFRCLAQIKISRSSLLLDPFYWFPELEDPHLEDALWFDPPQTIYDDTGRGKYMEVCKEEKMKPYRRVLESLDKNIMDMAFYGLNDREMKAICAALAINKHVKTVSFQENCLMPPSVCELDDMLRQNTTITHLDLRLCRIGPIGAEHFLHGLAFNSTVQELDLSYNDLEDEGAAHVANALRMNSCIHKLNLSHNNMNDKALEHLAIMMEDNYGIVDLDLSWNSFFKSAGLTMFMESLNENMGLKILNLSWCGMGDRDNMRPIYQYLRLETGKLEHLDLSNNRITGVAIKMLRTAFKYNEALLTLKLVGNPMSPAEVEWIAGSFSEQRETPLPLQLIDCSGMVVNKSFIKIRNQLRKKGFTILAGTIVGNYKVRGPVLKHVLLQRAKFVAFNQKKKKWRQDFGVFLVKQKDDPVTRTDFIALMKKNYIKMDKELLEGFVKEFTDMNTGDLDIKLMKQEYLVLYPDTKAPEKKKKKKKGKKKKSKTKIKKEGQTTDTEATTEPTSGTEATEPTSKTNIAVPPESAEPVLTDVEPATDVEPSTTDGEAEVVSESKQARSTVLFKEDGLTKAESEHLMTTSMTQLEKVSSLIKSLSEKNLSQTSATKITSGTDIRTISHTSVNKTPDIESIISQTQTKSKKSVSLVTDPVLL